MSDWKKLEGLLVAEDLLLIKADLAAMVDNNTLCIHCLCAVRKTKNYAALPLLEPCIRGANLCEFYPLVTDAVQDGTIPLLEKFLPQKLEPGWVSRACGSHGVDFDLIPEFLALVQDYIEGLIEGDNLDLFLKYQSLYDSDVLFILARACKYCARRIITHFGFSKENVEHYLTYVFLLGNKDTLRFLYDKCVGDPIEHTFLWFLSTAQANFEHSFLVDCFNNKLITLSEGGWQRLKSHNPELYEKVQDDV